MSISIMTETRPESAEQQHHEVLQRPSDEPCSGCKQLQKDVAKTISMVMERMDKLQYRLDELLKENNELKSSSVSSGKASPSPAESRSSPKLVETVVAPVSGARKRKPKERSPPAAASPLPDFSNLMNGFMFDPLNMSNPNGMMQLLSMVQQQQQQQQHHQHIENQQSVSPPQSKSVKIEDPMDQDVKQEESERSDIPTATEAQNLLDALTAQFSSNGQATSTTSPPSSSSQVQAVIEAVATPSSQSQDSSMFEKTETSGDPNAARCSNCRTDKTTAWRRDAEGKLVCNPCGLYYRLHKVRRPIEMRKNHIQQRYRRKNKEKESSAATQIFNQLLTQMPTMATGGVSTDGAINTFNLLEQISQFTQAQELMNSSATF
ncbi:Putative transcription factor egl-18 [Caenorhabditis elegans]|uniref:Putative transcription factor egl-18 n=1 Tax=Caenorhabditis elegans TaxID=6239 RepID=EGL18_CAEEL|nr:Putative transcription factor egl-18 [Caenorhabditis elegans]G5EGF4.1 RecName: Full=Putative transcription factor egl-18; AltName: Full=Egg laying defective egl-18; AltName: Full=Erythroid-like transcription factor family egl-18 [Caenorhabditis elegans]AAK32716.1 GATA-like transcription factor ELT-5 [Caenorhabditis elegans]CCD71858.1 Putative transcription factor egl-18 [Caenorhabditis elegans]|eukprot:NP_500143.1 Uncharacterized protein CELE_F55A8.1 [Caenorhabditis elegans]